MTVGKVRFTDTRDCILLKEVLAVNPFMYGTGMQGWTEVGIIIAKHFGRPEPVLARTAKNRVKLILDDFKATEAFNRKQYGVRNCVLVFWLMFIVRAIWFLCCYQLHTCQMFVSLRKITIS